MSHSYLLSGRRRKGDTLSGIWGKRERKLGCPLSFASGKTELLGSDTKYFQCIWFSLLSFLCFLHYSNTYQMADYFKIIFFSSSINQETLELIRTELIRTQKAWKPTCLCLWLLGIQKYKLLLDYLWKSFDTKLH